MNTRFPHVLKCNRQARLPSLACFFDTETKPVSIGGRGNSKEQRLLCGHAIVCRMERGEPTRRKEIAFSRPAEFWKWLESQLVRKKTLHLFAHNAGYDASVCRVWDQVDSGRYKISKLVTGDPPTFGTFDTPAGRFRLIDTFNYFRQPLSEIADWVKLPKKSYADACQSLAALRDYCKRDAEIVERAFLSLYRTVRESDVGNFSPTLAGLAWNAFRHGPMTHQVFIHCNREALRSERAAFFGGRVEAFFCGRVMDSAKKSAHEVFAGKSGSRPVETGPVYALDVNSLYPSVMATGLFPVRYCGVVETPSLSRVREMVRKWCVVATVDLDAHSRPFPRRHEKGTAYATGKFTTTLTTPEVAAAIEGGHVAKFRDCHYYEAQPLFSAFVAKYWRLREEAAQSGDFVKSKMIKLLMNSLFGKFGQRSAGWEDAKDVAPVIDWGQFTVIEGEQLTATVCRAIGGNVQRRGEKGEGPESFPAIAAHVTSYARCRMQDLYDRCRCGKLFYTDTDSLHVDSAALDALRHAGELEPDRLGKLRLVAGPVFADYRGKKDYRLGDSEIIAGLPAKRSEIEPRVFRFTEFERLDQLLDSKPGLGPKTREVEKRLSDFDAGSKRDAGGWLLPVVISR